MDMMKNAYNYTHAGVALTRMAARCILLLLLLAATQGLRAQGWFTLTNGHYYWFDGRESDPDDSKYLTGFDQANGWAQIYKRGTHATASVTEIVEQGDTYLALDLSNPSTPRIVNINTDGGFTPYCVWYRTGNTGSYYQEWDGYRYYLVASHSEGLRIYKVAAGAPLMVQTQWYNWDHGAAISEEVQVPGGTSENYYWLMYDNLNDADGSPAAVPEWRMSTVSSYQRPEEMIYRNYRADGAGGNTWDNASDPDRGITYYDNVRVGGMTNYPAGLGATFMAVGKTEHPMVISGLVSGHGLNSVAAAEASIGYGESVGLTADVITTTSNDIHALVTDAYTEYNEETYRRGVNLNSHARTENIFGSAGIPTVHNWYYYGDANSDGIIDRNTVPPTEYETTLSIASVEFTVDERSRRYLSVSSAANGDIIPGAPTASNNTHHWHSTLTCNDLPQHPTTATITVTVTYSNGTTQTLSTTILVTPSDLSREINSRTAPVIKGYVVGGGRMANVGGNTSVTVHNADSIYAIYGGNDIAGWVQGDGGATIQVGTRYTNDEHPIHIDYIYGGGCGFYRYSGVYDAVTFATTKPQIPEGGFATSQDTIDWAEEPSRLAAINAAQAAAWGSNDTKVRELGYGDYAFRGGVYDWYDPTKVVVAPGTFDYAPYKGYRDFALLENGDSFVDDKLGGTIPYVKTSHISIGVPEETGHTDALRHNAHEHNDNIFIDSVFGGAENAFIGITSTADKATAITVDINGGTILTAFGGNNYGGAIANYSLTYVNVNCTRLVDDRSLTANSYFHGYGRDFGIRHLFGGGNKVDATHAELNIRGGMIDTAFVGGNNATVLHPVGIVDCQRNGTAYNAYGEETPGGFMNGHFIYTNNTITQPSDTANNGRTWEGYDADNGLFNVHYLYGGNNLAPMTNVSFVFLRSGGAGSVYGGGNMGDMINDLTLMESAVAHSGFINLPPLLYTMDSILTYSELLETPQKISSVIASMKGSKIMVDYLYGGCRNANIKNTCGIYAAGGDFGNIIAGNDVSGDVGSETDGSTYLVVTGETVVQGNIYGGCDGYYHCDRGDGHYSDQQIPNPFSSSAGNDPYNDFAGLLLPTQQHANVFLHGGLIKGDVVAGGLLADVGFPNRISHPALKQSYGGSEEPMAVRTNSGTVQLEIAGTAEIRGNVFGGGANASIWGQSRVLVRETPIILGNLFAGNDCVGRVESFLPYRSNMDDPSDPYSYYRYYYNNVYDHSASIAANLSDSVDYFKAHPMTAAQKAQAESLNHANQFSSNGDSLNFYTTTVDGVKQYNPRYSTYVLIEDSPVINSVYGSGNGAWNYDNDPNSPFPWVYVCPGQEGSRPNQASTFIDINTAGGFIDTVFGGGAGCSVSDKVVVLLNNKTADNPAYPDSIGSLPRFSHFVGGTSRTDVAGTNFVGTIFGGNNFSDMNVVPGIMLVKGNVKNVYGGGNKGDMTKKETVYDICGNEVSNVSTHILSESPNVTVTDSVFGGCRMSNLEGMAYVEVRQTSNAGIQYLYGGNDISGNINGNTRIDMAGGTVHRIWGGSNGRYDFVPVGEGLFNVYKYGEYDELDPSDGLIATAGKPDVDSTNVNLWGGIINSSVFTGGSMADCRATNLVVNDLVGCPGTGNLTVRGALYGGGEGRWDDLNARDFEGNRWGNVTGATHVHLHHAKNVTEAIAYGGGGGGDAANTNIIAHEDWNSPFLAIYGGCWGSDVSGVAYLEFNGDTLVNNLYGGNDFTGNVYRTEMLVNKGNFYNVFGGGNGDYADSYYHTQHPMALRPEYAYQNASATAYAGGDSVERPNTEYIHIVFNGGEVDSCLYGGGRRGTVLPYQKNSNGEYIINETRLTNDGVVRYVPDTVRTKAQTVSDPDDFAYIVLNVHGGKFHRNVFGGGRGYKKNKTPIVYGLKVANMDGGEIYESLYGGSEFINDGYPAECKAAAGADPTFAEQMAVSTRRPSSIVNFTGGTVGGNFYGTGYQGLVFGSSYVNIGIDAIDSCTVWRNSYGNDTEDSTYIMFKPGVPGSQSDALSINTVTLRNSVYSGANWGLASGMVTFDNPGFIGGESRMYVDGNGYNTTNDLVSPDPEMVIIRSLFGSGTSVLGGDIHSHIELRNYGGMETCHPTKILETIQRTDSLWLHNTAIILTGTTDASQQYMSNRYSVMNVRQMNYRGYNVSELQASASNVENLGFFEQGTTSAVHTDVHFDTVEVPLAELNVQIDGSACGDGVDICDKEYMVSPTEPSMRHTLIILDNGINFIVGDGTNYGEVTGYGFVTAPGGYQSRIMARPKMEISANHNMNDGGFVTTCDTVNKTRTIATSPSQINTDWEADGRDELPYTNYALADAGGFTGSPLYREWKVGDKHGLREVEATLLAHSDPSHLDKDWSLELTCGTSPNTGTYNLSIAEAVFELPATEAGHYYMLTGEGFTMTGTNGEIDLVDSAWHPDLTAALTAGGNLDMSDAMGTINNWYSSPKLDPNVYGSWINIPDPGASMEGTAQIRQLPNYTFGLVMAPNANFATVGTNFDMPASIDHDDNVATPNRAPDQDWAYFIVNGNARVNSINHYCSPKVFYDGNPANPEIKPSMRLYLTYDTSFTNTFNGNVTFQMMEYDADGKKVAPILVKINIQTIIDKLKDMDQDVLAMYNGGRTNTFTRKVELVPCGEERNLYITAIRWLPTDNNGNDSIDGHMTTFTSADRFSLLGDPEEVQAVYDGVYPHAVSGSHPGDGNHNSHNRFALNFIPSNNVSEDAGMANGWLRGVGTRTNLYKLRYSGDGATPVKTLEWDADGNTVTSYSLKGVNGNDDHGYFLGTLDGRGSAMLDVELTFDGTRVYDDMDGKGYVGKAVLTMETFTAEDDISRGTFEVTIYVKTREHGDTIYMASASSVSRQIDPDKILTVYPYNDIVHNPGPIQKNEIGKSPGLYVQTFQDALADGIYEEGDVLCIMDEVIIDNTAVHITGPNGPPIEVIRYDGHHHQLPDEQSVYRGPMVVVRNEGSFTADNILFHGGAGSHIKHVKRSDGAGDYDGSHHATLDGGGNLQFWDYTYGGKTIDKLPDTNRAFGPIIQASGNGSMVHLREGTIVQHNWNEYSQVGGDGMPASPELMGAISVTDGALLTLGGNVTVQHNFSHPVTGLDDLANADSISVQKAPGGAAIYVDGGTVELVESNRNTAVTITNNYLMNSLIYTDPSAVTWWDLVEVDGVPERYSIDPADLATWKRANLLLTREAPTSGTHYEQVTEDTQSDIIVVSGTVGDETKIGVRKWFPGIHERDTIRFATVVGGNNSILATAVNDHENFISDEGFSTFYNPLVNLTTAYFFRCASFRHQLAAANYVDPVYEYSDVNTPAHTLTLASGDVLSFGARHIMCPTGGDSIIYRVQGGMMPYTFTWTDLTKAETLKTTVTPYGNAQVQHDLADHTLTVEERVAKYAASMADTLLMPAEEISTKDNMRMWDHLRVTAVDATGECRLYKDIDLRIVMDNTTTNPVTYWPKASAIADTASHVDNSSPWKNDTVGTGWTDTLRTVHAVASRNFSGVHITPRVWVDRSQGTISATVVGDDNDYIYQFVDNETSHELTNLNFCPGDTIYLYTEPRGASSSFIMWDFDPYYRPLALYTVPAHNDTVTAYYGPNDYWHEVINNTTVADAVYDDNFIYTDNGGHSFVNTYNGDVHIYDEKGLAWLISRVNGFNGQQSRSFHFNRVLIHAKSNGDPYDMKDHLWYPLGTEQHPFMGRLFGVSSDAAADLPWSNIDGTDTTFYTPVVIKNIIVNEPEMFSAGIFGYLDSAGIYNIDIQGEMVRGSQYVGGVAGISSNSYVRRTYVRSDIEDNALSTGFTSGQIPTTILTTHYVSGGMLGKSTKDTVTASNVAVKFVGDAVYGGGGIGYGRGSIIYNVTGHNYNRQEGLYLGGIAGYLNDTMPYNAYPTSFFGRLFGKGKATTAIPSQVLNNYFRITNEGSTQRLGGVVGYAENTIIENNYVYGDLNAMNVGGVTALAGSGTKANHNYYASESASRATYSTQGDADMGHTSDFDGQGNQVLISEPAYGTNNLTRALNLWVREHNEQGGNFFTWRSDLEGNNFGYPIFGRPDMIPVSSTTTVDGCSEVEYDGITYYEDATLQFVIIDSIEMIDSTATIHIRVHNAVHTVLNDSTESYAGYQGYGFTVTPTETMLLGETMRIGSTAQLVLTDTLQTAFGCDSIVTLMLVVTSAANDIEDIEVTEADIKVYPNPTTDMVMVETSEMSRVEIYDNEGRRLEDYTVNGDIYRLSMGHLASGVYYLRVHTPRGVTIQKVVKK